MSFVSVSNFWSVNWLKNVTNLMLKLNWLFLFSFLRFIYLCHSSLWSLVACRWAVTHGSQAPLFPVHPAAGLAGPSLETLLWCPEAPQQCEEWGHHRHTVSGWVQPAENDVDGNCLWEGKFRMHSCCFVLLAVLSVNIWLLFFYSALWHWQ